AGDEHVSDMAAAAGRRLLAERGMEPAEVDALVYFGSTWKDFAVWHAAPRVAHLLGCRRAMVIELDYVSCGAPVAVRVCRNLLRAEEDIRTVLAAAACRESGLVDFANPRARFTYNFGDGAVAALFVKSDPGQTPPDNEVLGCHMITDGSFSH